jgi:hypothetical protein
LVFSHTIILPELPVEVGPRLFQRAKPCPRPGASEVVAIPQKEMRECGSHPEVGGQKLNYPSRSVERKPLFSEKGRIHFVVGIQNEELCGTIYMGSSPDNKKCNTDLIVLCSVGIKKRLRKLEKIIYFRRLAK